MMGIQVTNPKAMFTFGVNSMFASAGVCVCGRTLVPREPVSRSGPSVRAEHGPLAPPEGGIKHQRCKAEGTKNLPEKCL